jgi:hypothetical protein
MAERLKSISKQIRWSLALRALIFAAVWFFLPYWLFALVALYCYFVPLFRPWKLFIPFFCIMVLAFIYPAGILFAAILGVMFYCTLLIKDLLVVNRRSMYEILVLALFFFLIRNFFEAWTGFGGGAFIASFFCAVLIGFLTDNIMHFFASETLLPIGGMRRISGWLMALLSWQALLVGLLLPLDFVYQSIIVFVAITFFYELIIGHFFEDLSRERIFVTAGVFFSLLALLLASAPWRI